MTLQIRKSSREQVKMKMALCGPSGSGKTYSSLLLAHGLCNDWSKICLIDTENGSADLYAHLGDFNVVSMSAPLVLRNTLPAWSYARRKEWKW